jgi:cyclophilin family peptidyl-prolyl cis-trans isomerase
MTRAAGVALSLLMLPTLAWAAPPPAQPAAAQPAKAASNPKAVVKTSLGTFEIELDRTKAPKSVENFMRYARDGHYEKTIFHRVIKDFMVQGGGMDDKMKEKTTRSPVKNESDNGLSNQRGTVAMARTSNPDSATSQFYVNHRDNSYLDGRADKPGYTVFGRVVKGMEVVDKIAAVPTSTVGPHAAVPVNPVYIESVTVQE